MIEICPFTAQTNERELREDIDSYSQQPSTSKEGTCLTISLFENED
jgi:hypothetical protein